MSTSLLLFYSCVSFTNHCYKAQHFSPALSLLNGCSCFVLVQNTTSLRVDPCVPRRSPDLTSARGRAWLSGRSPGAPQSTVPQTSAPLQPLHICSSNSTSSPELSSLSWTQLTLCKIHSSEGCDWGFKKAPVNRNLLLAYPSIYNHFVGTKEQHEGHHQAAIGLKM